MAIMTIDVLVITIRDGVFMHRYRLFATHAKEQKHRKVMMAFSKIDTGLLSIETL